MACPLNFEEANLKNSDDAVRVLEFLRLEDQPEKSDVIFILGGSSLAPVRYAAKLYHKGFAPYIAFISIGGYFGGDKVWGVPEHIKYRQVLNNLGIPDTSIFSAGLSTNTLEEAKQTIPFLKENGIDAKKIILVARQVNQRRAWATFSKQQPDIKFINCPAPEHINDIEPNRLVNEIGRLIIYSAKGDLLQVHIPDDILSSVNKIIE